MTSLFDREDPSEYYDEGERTPKRCRYCSGTGNDGEGSNYYPCPDCNGTGRTQINEEKEDEDNE